MDERFQQQFLQITFLAVTASEILPPLISSLGRAGLFEAFELTHLRGILDEQRAPADRLGGIAATFVDSLEEVVRLAEQWPRA